MMARIQRHARLVAELAEVDQVDPVVLARYVSALNLIEPQHRAGFVDCVGKALARYLRRRRGVGAAALVAAQAAIDGTRH
jgi:hypothetical protein